MAQDVIIGIDLGTTNSALAYVDTAEKEWVVRDLATGPYRGKETGETALFRELLEQLQRGDLVLADRYYCSYFMVALLQSPGVDVDTLFVETAFVDKAPNKHMRRWRPRAMGRATRVQKGLSHITIILGER